MLRDELDAPPAFASRPWDDGKPAPATGPDADEPPLAYYDQAPAKAELDAFHVDERFARATQAAAEVSRARVPTLAEARERIPLVVQMALKEYLKGDLRDVRFYQPTLVAQQRKGAAADAAHDGQDELPGDDD